jgi:hypothetical protein
MNLIAANQSVSLGVYSIAVQESALVPHSFYQQHAHRVDRAYAAGEPIWMIADELKMLFSILSGRD